MKKRNSITIGLAFQNAILFGLLFIFLGLFIFYQLPKSDFKSKDYLILFVGIVTLILGLIPLTTIRRMKIEKDYNEIFYFNCFLFFLKIGKKYKLNEFDTILVGSKIRTYASGGGFLITAQSFNSIKETDIWIMKSDKKNRIEIKNVGSKKKTNRIISEILNLSDLKVK